MRFRFNDEQRQLIKEIDAIEAKIFSHEESLTEERHSKSQLSLSSKNIAGFSYSNNVVSYSYLTLTYY